MYPWIALQLDGILAAQPQFGSVNPVFTDHTGPLTKGKEWPLPCAAAPL